MMFDDLLKLKEGFNLSGAASLTVISDVIPMSTVRDFGSGNPLAVHAIVTTALATGTSANCQLWVVAADSTDLTTNPVTLACGPMIGHALHAGGQLPAVGHRFSIPVPSLIGQVTAAGVGQAIGVWNRSYLGVAFYNPVAASTFTAGAFTLHLGLPPDSGNQIYPGRMS